MKRMAACAPYDCAVIAWVLDVWRTAVICGAADPAHIVVALTPGPLRHAMPVLDGHMEAHAERRGTSAAFSRSAR